jgi:arylsulfotransferase ASST
MPDKPISHLVLTLPRLCLAAFAAALLAGVGLPASALATAAPQPPVPIAITTAAGQTPAPGYFLVDPYQLEKTPVNGPEIVNNQGQVVWYYPMKPGVGASNFQIQTYKGQRVLTFWEGTTGNPAYGAIGSIGIGQGEDVIMNSHYKIIATFKGAEGLQPDAHEFTLTPNGDALITAYSVDNNQPVEPALSASLSIGPTINVVDSHALVVDMKTDKIVMDWDALKHVPLTASDSLPGAPWDYFHINSISLDPKGNLLIDSRNTWAMYDVNIHTGAVNWQLGGRGSSFTLEQGVAFSWQHDTRFISPDEISLFDDGEGYPGVPTALASRAEWIKLNMAKRTATLVRQIAQPSGQPEAWSQGSVQDLPGGGTVVGWGSAGTFTEYSKSGALVLTGKLPGGPRVLLGPFILENAWNSYRTFKLPWAGTPATPPAIAVQSAGIHQWTISAAWNGDTEITRWRVFAGSSRSQLHAIKTVGWAGLNTAISLSSARFRYVRVEALGHNGLLPGATSRIAKL